MLCPLTILIRYSSAGWWTTNKVTVQNGNTLSYNIPPRRWAFQKRNAVACPWMDILEVKKNTSIWDMFFDPFDPKAFHKYSLDTNRRMTPYNAPMLPFNYNNRKYEHTNNAWCLEHVRHLPRWLFNTLFPEPSAETYSGNGNVFHHQVGEQLVETSFLPSTGGYLNFFDTSNNIHSLSVSLERMMLMMALFSDCCLSARCSLRTC